MSPVVVGLTGLGLSRPEIARLVSLVGEFFRGRSVTSKLSYLLSLFDSHENLLRVVKHSPNLLERDLDRVVKPNAAFLRECGLGASCDIVKLCLVVPWLLTSRPERVHAMLACAEGLLGVPRGSGMFRPGLQAAVLEFLKKSFRWSDAEVGIAVSKAPVVLTNSNDMLKLRSEFLISEVGLKPAYIAYRPAMLKYRLEGWLRPRHYVVKFLKENGLLDHHRDYYNTVTISDKVFMEKFTCPHKEAAPHLVEDYGAACRGEVPAIFRFT